jgi:glyoxylase-like metal-dependent hydrolase (beta-lactamase superfamily II)
MHGLPILLALAAAAPQYVVVTGPVNGLLLRDGARTLAVYGDPGGKAKPEMVLLTSARRDTAWASAGAAQILAPAGEAALIGKPEEFWQRFWEKERFHDYASQGIKWPARGMGPVRAVKGGEKIVWGGARIEVMDTPGYTRGAVSYLVEVGGKRIACPGDLILEDGKLFDLYSLQDAIPELKVRGYHGYAARAAQLIGSLQKVAAWKPDLIVPVRGKAIAQPLPAIGRLIGRLRAVYANYLYTDAYRWYFGDDNWRARARRVLGGNDAKWMTPAEVPSRQPPAWIRVIGNSRLVVSASGAALLVDAGYSPLPEELRKLRAAGGFARLEEIHITHYHDDHTDYAQRLAEEWKCPVVSTPFQKTILETPAAFHMPCLTDRPIRGVQEMPAGASRRWHEFRLTKFDLPGQTLYHDGLLVEKDGGETVFFAGDSFTPTGLDDYCLLNRNPVAEGAGFLQSLAVLRRLPPGTLLINQHVVPVFRFSAQQIDAMEASLRTRRELLKDLIAWEDPDFGVDEQWIRLEPHGSTLAPGSTAVFRAVVRNPSRKPWRVTLTPRLPPGWSAKPVRLPAAAGRETAAEFRVTVPAAAGGLQVLTADVEVDGRLLREWCEAVVMVRPADR